MKSNLNILLVDDHLVVRKGIELIIADSYENAVIHSVESYSDALEILKTIKVDLILLDIIMNGVENIKIMKEIKAIQKNAKILIFSCHEEEFYGLRYIKNGADGYLHKFCTEEKLIEVIKEILKTGNYYSLEIKNKLKKKVKENKALNPIETLSNREFEIAKMLLNGSGNLEISNKLNIQMSTVSTYKSRVFEKLSVNNLVALSDVFKDNLN